MCELIWHDPKRISLSLSSLRMSFSRCLSDHHSSKISPVFIEGLELTTREKSILNKYGIL